MIVTINGEVHNMFGLCDALLLLESTPGMEELASFISGEITELEQDYNALIQEARGWSDSEASVWEASRDNVYECKEEAEAGLALLQSRKLNRKKLQDVFNNIIRVFNNNY